MFKKLVDKQYLLKKAVKVPETFLVGIYFLINDYEVVYVGQSTNIASRIVYHVAEGRKIFDSYSYVECEKSILDDMESLYIDKYIPKYNDRRDTGITHKGWYSLERATKRLSDKFSWKEDELYIQSLIYKYPISVLETECGYKVYKMRDLLKAFELENSNLKPKPVRLDF